MRAKAGLFVSLLVCISGAVAFAHPSLGGPTGLVTLPTADALGLGQVEAALDVAAGDDITIVPLRVAAGVGRGAEMWGLWAHASDGTDRITGYGGKIGITRIPIVGLAIAGGAGFYKVHGGADLRTFYVVGRQELSRARLHLGLLYQKVDDAAISTHAIRPFAGLDVPVGRDVTLVLEGRRRWAAFDNKDILSAAVRWPIYRFTRLGILKQVIMAEIGVTNGAFLGSAGDATHVFFGLDLRPGLNP